MNTTLDRQDPFLPPSREGRARAFVLSLSVHLLLLLALTWGISWHQQAQLESSSTELWPATPNLTPAPTPPEVLAPTPEPEPTPPPPTPKQPPPPQIAPSPNPPADLGIEKLKAQKKLEEEKKALEKKALKERLDKEQREREQAKDKERKKEKELEKAKAQELAKQAAKDAAKDKEKKRAQEAKDAKDQERRFKEDLSKFAGTSPGPARSSNLSNGPSNGNSLSSNYLGKLKEFFDSNTRQRRPYPERPVCSVIIRTSLDGKILSWSFEKHSTNPDWDKDVDDSLQRIYSQSKPLPKSENGSVPYPLPIFDFTPPY